MSKILIVDDDSVATSIYEGKFHSLGFETQTVSSGKEAKAQLAKLAPDVILLDLVLGDISGIEVLKFIRSQKWSEAIPVVVLSNTYMGELIEEAWNAGATKCLSKTATSLTRVGEVVQKLLVGRKMSGSPAVVGTAASGKESNASFLADEPEAVGSSPLSEQQLQTNLRRQLHQAVLQRIEEMNQQLQTWQADPSKDLLGVATEIRRSNHALISSAALGGLPRLAQLAGALEALLTEIQTAKVRMSASALQTVRQTVEFLPRLLRDPASTKVDTFESPLILVLDDDVISRKMLCTLLKKVRLNALAVSEPAIAVRLFAENRFDLVFCDVEMPGMNGFELGNKLRESELNEATPIVYVTSHGDIKARDRSAKVGAVDFITKPVGSSELALKAMLHLFRGNLLRPTE